MHQVLIALGSNYRQNAHIQWTSERLSCLLDDPHMSRKLWTQDIHGTGQWYMNRLVAGDTSLSLDEINKKLKEIETEAHRSSIHITIDMDLMLYDSERHHLQDWTRPYITNLLPYMVFDEKLGYPLG
jgi:2-amino-4-hydroxy-6-hydroxymethyldihydropteridine diphosphokinase